MKSLLLNRLIGNSLRTRLLLIVVAVMALLIGPALYAFSMIGDQVIWRFAHMVAEKQVQYDRYRGLETLHREVSLAETMSRAPALIAWALDETDPDNVARGLAEMEHYRSSFADQSVFVIIDRSGRYYYNDALNSYGDDPYRYTVRSDNSRDGWYFTTRARREGCYPNVDHDDVLAVTKVWINCLMTHEGNVIGIVGTGLDLSGFIREVVDLPQPGIQSIFVDASGAVQAHQDASLVDFHSLTKDAAQKTTVFSMLDSEADMALLRSMMNRVPLAAGEVQLARLSMQGREVLVGVGFLDRIGWYNVTVIDPKTVIERPYFMPVALLMAGLLIAGALIISLIFKVAVLDRLGQVEAGLNAVRDGKRASMTPDRSRDEIGRLSRALIEMSDTITEGRMDLEAQVRERTEQLEALVNLDSLTGICNRRGFGTAFNRQQALARKNGWSNGLILIDIDNFKTVNDTEGHAAGDQVVVEVARRLSAAVRRGDVCARWGGDEFIVLIRECDVTGLRQVAAALRDMMRKLPVVLADGERLEVTVSIGAALVTGNDALDLATDMADAALYSAKENGRDCVVVFGTDPLVGQEGDAAKIA